MTNCPITGLISRILKPDLVRERFVTLITGRRVNKPTSFDMKSFSLWILLSALVAAAQADSVNVAPTGTVSANGALYGNASIYRLIDADRQTVFHGDTSLADGFAYTLDLGQPYAINKINVFPRQDGCCPERLSNVRVSIYSATADGQIGTEVWGTNLFTNGTNPGSDAGALVEIPLPTDQTGRFVEIRALSSPVPDYSLQMTEMEVFATLAPSEVNRAIGALASANQAVWPGTSPANLVNGSRNDFVHGIAGLAKGYAYTINLGVEVDISKMIIVPRQDGCCGERLSNYRVSVLKNANGSPGETVWSADLHTDGTNIGAERGAAEVITKDLNPNGVFKGQFIKIESLDDPVPDYALQIAEVEVHGTPAAGVSLLMTKDLQDTPVGIGQSATLSVAVNAINGDTNLLSYQWQVDGVNIAGATERSYTTPPVLSADSGKKYRVIVSYPGQPDLTSHEATLTANYAYHAATFSNRILWKGGGWSIDKLVNGDRQDVFHGDVDIEPGFAYQARLAAPLKFDSIVIYPRQDGCCPERLTNFRVSIHKDNNGVIGDKVWSADLFTDGTNPGASSGVKVVLTKEMDPAGTFEGQWIEILSLEDPVQNYALQMTELEAYGSLTDSSPKLSLGTFPTTILAAPGRSTTITATANVFNGDISKVTYRWKKNGEFIPGATEATYATGLLTDADANARYRVVLSYPGVADVESADASIEFDYNYARGSKPYTSQPLWLPGGWNISMLVDGNRRGVFHGHTGIQPGYNYTVDLGTPVNLEKIDIYPRQDGCCPERLSNFRVSVHNDNNGAIGQEVWSADLFTDGSNAGSGDGTLVTLTADLDPDGVFKGQWIKIQSLSDPVPDYDLQMTELEAIGRIQFVPPPTLSIARTQNGTAITWSEGILEHVANLGETWTPVPNALSPYPVSTSETRHFYRVKK